MWQPCELLYTCYLLTRKVKPIWILLKQETVSDSGISWAICKSAHRSRQITTPAPHHSVFLQAGCPSCRPANSVKALKAKYTESVSEKKLKSMNIWQSYEQKRGCLMHLRKSSSFSSAPASWHKVHETATFLLVTVPNIHRL